ncbi:FeoB-associated Cys-rich membrane protein [Macrococcus hajekii]|uniref:FeoB-associated Cys-rich membrane protein n=1 Tax=Macrococcus hajekii TaxID=198482 RepID=A0A4R6BII7_9STAP|nr:FeoB-associated Cys-rich membrane protein [Macrococcus hajekii]TDM01301.1 FeoB-associated Cys-rich membrane protein [Macrococcus hajekii]GGB10505.1 hypothetical protein GCM10007190_18160 [Macrococcus hajekii]
MSLLINLLLTLLIFGYAIYTLIKFFKKSKEGKCNSCSVNQDCGCHTPGDKPL